MIADYEHVGVKGQGYFCIVKKYKHKATGVEIAVKELKSDFYDNEEYRYRFAREIELLKELGGCENIIELLGEGKLVNNKEISYYAMPFADFNLYNYIKRHNGTLTLENRISIIEQIVTGLEYAHAKDILHRDLSPTNIFVFQNNGDITVKIADFGLGKNAESLSHYTNSSKSGYGQLFYVSPEQYNQLKYSTKKSDIYSLGKVCYFIVTGKDPKVIENCELSSLIQLCSSEIPDERFNDLNEFKSHLNSLKQLLFTNTIDLDYTTIRDYISNNTNIDWTTFHTIALKSVSFSHVFTDYIDPIINLFLLDKEIVSYYQTIKSGIRDFVTIFIKNLHDCYQTMGWPFSKTESFGKLLYRFYTLIPDNETKLHCLNEIWYLAFVSDQWKVQTICKQILNNNVPNEIELSFSKTIIDSNVKIRFTDFAGINLQPIIKKALIQIDDKK